MMAMRGFFGDERAIELTNLAALEKRDIKHDCSVNGDTKRKDQCHAIGFGGSTSHHASSFCCSQRCCDSSFHTHTQQNESMTRKMTGPSISVRDLSYSFPDGNTGLKNISLELPAQSRTLLIGGEQSENMRKLRGEQGMQRLTPTEQMERARRRCYGCSAANAWRRAGAVNVGGLDPFDVGLEGVSYLGLEWVLNPIVRSDIAVPELLRSVGGDHYPERRDELVGILDVDLGWRLHAVSDGERRRVQLCMGLLRPWSVLLLDEITVDLDLLSRHNFLAFLKRETEARACTIVYATHILDNLADWPTHLVHTSLGKVRKWGAIDSFHVPRSDGGAEGNSRLGMLVMSWLREDLEERGPRNRRAPEGKSYESHEGKGGYGLERKDG